MDKSHENNAILESRGESAVEINDFDVIDGLLAIGYFVYYAILIYVFGLLVFKTEISTGFSTFENNYLNRFIFCIPITLITVVPVFAINHYRKRSISSLGIMRKNTVKSIISGILFSLPYAIPVIVIGVSKGARLVAFDDIIWSLIYLLICIGFVEEFAFRGFIQTRIRGIIKNKWISVVIVGVMFAFLHVPFQMLIVNMSFLQYIQLNLFNLIKIAILHAYFVYIYTRENNILAPTVTHTIFNLLPAIFIY